jgi:hypothetical protein
VSDYFASVQAAGDGEPSWAVTSQPVDESAEPAALEPQDAAAEPAASEWEPLVPASLEERVAAVESWLGPRVIEMERAEELARHQALVDQAHGMPAGLLAEHAAAATQRAIEQRLGIVEQPPTVERFLQAGEEIAAAHVPEWADVRERVFEEMQARPQWLLEAQANPSPAVLGQTFVSVASTLKAAETARSQMHEAKREAQTLSGGSNRPATQTPDEQYWEAIRAAGSGGYR